MKKIFTNILISTMILSTVSGAFPVTAFANHGENPEYSNNSSYCKDGEEISVAEAARAYTDGKISFELSTSTNNTFATLNVVNKTNCKFPVSLSSYKMFDGVLSHQELYDGIGTVQVGDSATISVKLPSCMAQIDAWFGQYPSQLLDSNPYGYPNVPMVIAFKFLYNSGTGYGDPIGPLCTKETPNTPPVITLIGSSTVSVTVGDSYTDQGATANDLEDGNITNKIVKSGDVNTNVVGAYTITYNVTDSKGLNAVEVKRIVNVYPPIAPKTAIISTTKIVCDSETDLPNYGNGGPDITNTTASEYIGAHPTCKIVPWTFEWATKDTTNPGDSVKIGGEKWTSFSNTVSVPSGDKVWIREQFDSAYIPFSGNNTTQSVSAELYCDVDVLNYDNYDWIVPSVSGKTYYCVAWNVLKSKPVNTAPVITLVGTTPMNVYIGSTFTDPGATANDLEDGDITNKIVTSGTVNTNVVGIYTITYNVKDSQNLEAVEVSRTVNVLEVEVPPNTKGKITFCMVVVDDQNVIATSSAGLPTGTFTIDLATSTNIASSTIKSKTWASNSFAPNQKLILSAINDSDCVTYSDLDFGIYRYSELNVQGLNWSQETQYNDQDTQPVNNVFDFFLYDETINTNSDGYVIIGENRKERTVVILNKYNSAPQCVLPEISSPLTATGVVGSAFTYTFTASTTNTNLTIATTTLPAWLTYATSTSVLSGTPTATGTFSIPLTATNTCGVDTETLVVTVTSNGGGGGGGPTSDIELIKTADKSTVNPGDTVTYTLILTNKGPSEAISVALSEVLPTTLTFVSGTTTKGLFATTTGQWTVGNLANNASTTLTIVATVNSDTFGQKIVNTATASSTVSDPNSINNTSTFEINVTPAPTGCTANCGGGGGGGGNGGGGGGNGPISTFVPSNGPIVPPTTVVTTPNSCYYLYDYLRKDFNNNPVEVKKLQVFLRDLEGFSTVQVTGVYDDQTIVALDAFQDRYKGDILTPWGHTAPTSYTYILTKKKVNEIYCKMAFPVTVQQQIEIDTYRNFLQGLKDAGITLPDGTIISPSNPSTPTNPIIDGQVGGNIKDSQGTLAGYSSSTQKFVNSLTANVIASGKKFLNYLLGLFTWPFGKEDKTGDTQCVNDTYLGLGWLNYILILIIILVSYLWYREYWNNRTIEEINKQIDLE